MTEQSNAELIAASETWTPAEVHASPVGAARIIASLAAALETAEQRADDAFGAGLAQVARRAEQAERDRDQYAAVVEKVRAYLGAGKGAYAPDLLDILATAPADALRERDAEKWDEGDAARRMYVENRRAGRNVTMPRNPYRAREEQS